MNDSRDPREWLYLRVALGIVLLIVIVDVAAWKIHDIRHPRPTRLELTVGCLRDGKKLTVITPAGDPLADSAGGGSLKTTVEGLAVTAALASSQKQAIKLERYYRAVVADYPGRLQRRDRSVYLWRFKASPTQWQTMYDCQY